MRIAFVTSEMVPFAKTGGLADICGALPLQLEAMGHELVVIVPHYRSVGVREPFNDRANIEFVGQDIRVYFIKSRKYFDRPHFYGEGANDYPDNLDRFSFFCREALQLLKDIGKPVDIIHCHDWHAGLVPLLLKGPLAKDDFFAGTRTVFTVHNLAYQGIFPKEEFYKLGVDREFFNDQQVEFYGKINLMKTGIVFSDQVTTVSPRYAREIQTKEWGCGLDGVMQSNKERLTGILNKLDYKLWDPQNDVYVDPPYSAQDWLAKKIHKTKLQQVFGLSVLADIPVFGFVGRLCFQKGLDLIESSIDELMQRPLQLAFLGVGEDKYQKMLKRMARKYPQKCCVLSRFDEDISHQVYAGADFFLMPSVYEPCGLTQMIALRYGTIPLVSDVGGLSDTVIDISADRKKGNGFVFSSYSVSGFLEAVDRAMGMYSQKDRFVELMTGAMASRYTWESSAKEYVEVYNACRS